MKKLRLFDSLKFVLATVACMFILNVAHAATTAIQSVIAYGKTEQNGTPTPTNPVPIMTNNGVLKVSPNLFDINDLNIGSSPNDSVSYKSYAVPNGTYTMSTPDFPLGNNTANMFFLAGDVSSGASSTSNGVFQETSRTINVSDGYYTIGYRAGLTNRNNPKDYSWQIELGSTATPYIPYSPTGIYTDGTVETIKDSLNNTATAEMLLKVGDYTDVQEILSGAVTRNVGVKVLDGSEVWYNPTGYAGIYYTQDTAINGILTSSTNCISTHYVGREPPVTVAGMQSGQIKCGYINEPNKSNLYIKDTSFADDTELKAWLSQQYANGTPVIVVYPLATATTESVTGQSLTTAPVRQTAGSILGMLIEVVLGDGTREWVGDVITIATTRYNEEQFEPVKTDLSAAMDAVDDVVTRTMSQAQAIDTIATTKQTRPDEGCDAKYCLLVEDEDGTPHWYPIAGANGVAHNLPTGYTELQYIESTGTQIIDLGLKWTYNIGTKTVCEMLARESTALGCVGARNSGTVVWGNFSASNSTNYTCFGNKVNVTFNQNMVDGQFHEWETNNTGFYLDGVQKTDFSGSDNTLVSRDNIGLFGRWDGSGNIERRGQWKIKSHKTYNDGVLIQNLIPCRRKSDSVLGMYDLVSGQFFTNAGTGDFIAGPDM